MQSTKIIKRRIISVSNTHKIMKAMDLVAASKLQKAKSQMESAAQIFKETKRVVDKLKNLKETKDNIFVYQREVKNTAYIVITSDRGLCGGYNINIANKALSAINKSKNEKIFAIGLKGWEFFNRRRKNIVKRYVGISETSRFKDADTVGKMIMSMYTSGEVDEVYVAYTEFESMMSHAVLLEKILPIGDAAVDDYKTDQMRYEPDANTFLTDVASMYISSYIYYAMARAGACEQASRMISMEAAANNAEEIIEDLTLKRNRIRQGAITQEINEIVSGSNVNK